MKLVYTEVPVIPNLFRGPIIEGMPNDPDIHRDDRHDAASKDH